MRRPSLFGGLQSESQLGVPFPLIDLWSYYPELPPYRPLTRLDRLPLPDFSDAVDHDIAAYDIEVVNYDDSLAEYSNLDVGIPRAINVTDLGL